MINFSFWRQASLGLGLSLLASGTLNAQILQTFVAITPCRVVDTRNTPNGPLAGPIMAAVSTRSFPLPTSSCGLPANATAYALNVTVVPTLGLGYLSIWNTGATQPVVSTLNDFQQEVIANAAIVRAGTSGAISVFVTDSTHVVIDVNGYFLAINNSSTSNTSFGQGALPLTAGAQNTALGSGALGNNSTGNYNTAAGSTSLIGNTTGSSNTAYGQSAMLSNSTGSANTAIGFQTLTAETASNNNVAVGNQSMVGASGSSNVALGAGALSGSSGNTNISIGYQAGANLSVGDNNIDIGNAGVTGDAGFIRIGSSGAQGATFIAGVYGANVTGGTAVVVNANGQLGVVSSSKRFKEDIRPMADSSDRLMQLEPVTFRYKQPASDGSQPLQYGLVAEQVAAVYPELAVFGKDGQVDTVQYQQLPALLLNELQKQHQIIQDLQARINELEKASKSSAAVTVR